MNSSTQLEDLNDATMKHRVDTTCDTVSCDLLAFPGLTLDLCSSAPLARRTYSSIGALLQQYEAVERRPRAVRSRVARAKTVPPRRSAHHRSSCGRQQRLHFFSSRANVGRFL